jgi:hypothetical protein
MINREHQDRLETAVEALRQSVPATGPSDELLERTIARVGAGDVRLGSKEKGWWTMKVVQRIALGTGLAAAAIALCWMLFAMNGRLAFADVVERVNAAKMLRCKTTTEVEISGQGKVTQTGAVIMSQTWMIMRMPNMQMIINSEKGQMITLTEATKQAIVMNLNTTPAAAQNVNILDSFRKFDAKASQPLGEMQIDGKPARGFAIIQGNVHMRVWADLKTELPVRIEVAGANSLMPDTVTVMTDFDWNPTVTPEEIALEIPKDYAVINANIDSSKPSEADVTKMLTTWIALNGGKFPDNLTFSAMVQLTASDMAKRQVAETAGLTPEQKQQWTQKMTSELMQKMMPMTRGIGFIGDATAGTDWRYSGTGVTSGAKDVAILWYKPLNASTWRVFDADLSVHDSPTPPAGGTPVSLNLKDLLQTQPGTSQPATKPPLP